MSNPAEHPETENLSLHDCWACLRSSSIGRLAVISDGKPEIFPVNFMPDNATILFRTAPGTKLDAVAAGLPVVMEADGLNDYGTIAWSVVVKGTPQHVDPSDAPFGLAQWEPGVKAHLVRITPTEVTGRRFVINPNMGWWQPESPRPGA